jgi:hypothetical protein
VGQPRNQGFGLSNTLGVAGFPSAEAYKVGAANPYPRIPRVFLRQTINLGGEASKVGFPFSPPHRQAANRNLSKS